VLYADAENDDRPRETDADRASHPDLRRFHGAKARFVMQLLQGGVAGASIALHMQQAYLASQRQGCLGNEQFV